MSTPFFNTPERIAQLEAVAKSWEHTPFLPHGTIKGTSATNCGCSCQTLVTCVYKECGFLPADFTTPRYSLKRYAASGISQIKAFVDTLPQMEKLVLTGTFQPGDMLLFLSKEMEHSGIVLPNDGLVHSMFRLGVSLDRWTDAIMINNLAAGWRPIVL